MHAVYTKNKNIKSKPYYKYFVPAVICKLIGGVSLCFIYTYYYTYGGDVSNYFLTSKTFVIVLFEGDFSTFWDMINFRSQDIFLTGYDRYEGAELDFSPTDYYALFTVVLTIPFCILGFKSFLATTLLLAYFSFSGLWRLYEVFVDVFPDLKKEFALAIFFIPSVFFWGSGLLKDTYTLSALGFFTHGVYRYFIIKERRYKHLVVLIASASVMILIKPYIFFAILPGSLVWVFFYRIQKIKNPVLRVMILPIMLSMLAGLIIFSMSLLADYLGEYSLDKVLNKAVKTQQDLIRGEQYGNNNFDIGKFDPTIAGISSKIPVAINLALFRPYIWDANNPVMILSGLENLFMLGFSLYILFKVKITVLLKSLFSNPLLIFSFLFALFFAFSVGFTTANYGALVRLKIPCIPFYTCSLFIIYYLNRASFKRR
ncbi:MAG: hypothetical protein IT236_05310 [Bacteroidia bacterium]|nr:hypothetical protein [Bacteroidia bacterium]